MALGMWQCMTFVSCGGGGDKEKEAALCAERFAHCYFNFKYVDALAYTTEEAGGFVGCTIGMYASSHGTDSKNYADYVSFTCSGAEE